MKGLRAVALAALLGLTIAVPAVQAATPATSAATRNLAAAPDVAVGAHSSPALGYEEVCGSAPEGHAHCLALRRTGGAVPNSLVAPNASPSGYGPADIASAYSLPSGKGAGLTVAVVDAMDLPTAESDLATYRAQYGLPACTTANGCFRKVDQRGGTTYPAYDKGWAEEIALDIDMVSATCPACNILLVEADSTSLLDLAEAVDTAVSLGAVAVSNSYGAKESTGAYYYVESSYNHQGVAIVASSGDCGYNCAPGPTQGIEFPASSRYVVSVGGTSLYRGGGDRGWTESAWSGAGSGCSLYAGKPSWQTDPSCATRMSTDVSAVADPMTGVAVYNTPDGGWSVYGGTSASSPIIASIFALAGTPAPATYPASYIYGGAAYLNDVTSGNNASYYSCTIAYYCMGVSGYDGPTGLGTPNGIRAFNAQHAASPSAPRSAAATATVHGASVSWLAPSDNGGSTITGYTVTSSPSSAGCSTPGALSCSVAGLTPGTPYTFTVTATNALGTSPASGASNAVSPLAQVSGTISDTHGHQLAGLTVAALDGSKQVVASTATSAGGTYTLNVPSGSYTIHISDPAGVWPEGNMLGPGGWSATTWSVINVTSADLTGMNVVIPDAFPVSGYVSNGSTGIAGVTVRAYACAGTCVVGNATSAADGGYRLPLVPGAYIVGFSDPNAVYKSGYWTGSGYAQEIWQADAVTVVDAAVPGTNVTLPYALSKPTNLAATRLDGGATVTWSAPTHDGGSAITGYSVTSSPTSAGCTWTSGPLSCTLTGLTNGTSYTFRVTVTNGDGASVQSDASAPVTPAALPGAPTNVQAIAGMASASVAWTAAAPNGSAVTSYTVSSTPASAGCTTTGATSCTISNLAAGTSYTFKVRATNGVGDGAWSSASGAIVPVANGDTYYPLTPTRILDSRDGTGGLGTFHSHVAQGFTVAGRGGVPSNAAAVTGNLTVTGQTSLGFLYVGPVAVNDPTSSTLNFPTGDDRANAVTVQLSSDGKLYVTYAAPVRNTPTADVIFDVTGYFLPDAGGATYYPLAPTRILDSRDGTGGLATFHSHVAQGFPVRGRGGVPWNATAVTGNLTVTQQTSLGFLSIGPTPTNDPTSSTLNFPVGDDRANAVTVQLSSGGDLYVTYAAPVRSDPTAQVIFDVTGYFVPGLGGAVYVPVSPGRVLDSRDGTGGLGVFHSHQAQGLTVVGHAGVPTSAVAITGNLTVTEQSSAGFLYVGPAAANDPGSSNLNFPLRDDRANAVTVQLSGDGKLYLTYAAPTRNTPTAQVILDVTGYFTS